MTDGVLAAGRSAAKHLDLSQVNALILAGTGPVGQRAAALLVKHGARVGLASRTADRAQGAVNNVRVRYPDCNIEAVATPNPEAIKTALAGRHLVISAGAAGIELLPLSAREGLPDLKVAIDLNATPPLGIEGIEPYEAGVEKNGVSCSTSRPVESRSTTRAEPAPSNGRSESRHGPSSTRAE